MLDWQSPLDWLDGLLSLDCLHSGQVSGQQTGLLVRGVEGVDEGVDYKDWFRLDKDGHDYSWNEWFDQYNDVDRMTVLCDW